MLLRAAILLNICILVLVIAANFILKSKVSNLMTSLELVNRAIEKEEQKVAMLRAEFAYLTSPNYIQKISVKHLDLQNISSNQIIQDLGKILNKRSSDEK